MLHLSRYCIGLIVGGLMPLMAPASDPAITGTERLKTFGLAEGVQSTPSIGRVILVFLFVSALAWAGVMLLRRYGLRWRLGPIAGAGTIRHIDRSSLPGGVSCHVIEAEGARILIASSRNGLTAIRLGEPGKPAEPRAGAPH